MTRQNKKYWCRGRTIARFAVREAEVAHLAAGALATDDARFARALTTKLVAFEAHGTLGVALTRQCAAIELATNKQSRVRNIPIASADRHKFSTEKKIIKVYEAVVFPLARPEF